MCVTHTCMSRLHRLVCWYIHVQGISPLPWWTILNCICNCDGQSEISHSACCNTVGLMLTLNKGRKGGCMRHTHAQAALANLTTAIFIHRGQHHCDDEQINTAWLRGWKSIRPRVDTTGWKIYTLGPLMATVCTMPLVAWINCNSNLSTDM